MSWCWVAASVHVSYLWSSSPHNFSLTPLFYRFISLFPLLSLLFQDGTTILYVFILTSLGLSPFVVFLLLTTNGLTIHSVICQSTSSIHRIHCYHMHPCKLHIRISLNSLNCLSKGGGYLKSVVNSLTRHL
jgi:hypothetical protein